MSATYHVPRSSLGLPAARRLPDRPMCVAPPEQALALRDIEADEAALQRALEWARSRRRTSVGRAVQDDEE